ncbi:Protein of unknown function DUF1566 [Methylophilaceae bacterium]
MKKSTKRLTLSITVGLLLSSLILPSAFAADMPAGTVVSGGLTWTRNNSTVASSGTANWNATHSTCNALSVGGIDNWRLPTKQELSALFAASRSVLTSAGWTLGTTWSSTRNDEGNYYVVDLFSGIVNFGNGNGSYGSCVH